jgi:hypothetical protein
MKADLEKLRAVILPTSEEAVRASMKAYEAEPYEPGFVPALEHEMHEEFLACAKKVGLAVPGGAPKPA